jgi:hypothetical protein
MFLALNRKAVHFSLAQLATWLALAVVVGAFLMIQIRIHWGAYGESDSRAYLTLAKRLATGGPVAVQDKDPFLHHDHAWVETAQGKLVPKYPPGYPLMMVPFYWVAGDTGMLWASPLFGALALLGAFVLFREWMSVVAAFVATIALGLDGFVLFYSSYVLPHAADFCVVIWGMACLWRWMRRGQLTWGMGAGVLLGFAVLIRPANVLLGLPLAIVGCRHAWLGWKSKTGQKAIRELVWVAGGYLFMLALLATYQTIVFGYPLTSGYSLSGESSAFAWSFLGQRLPKYLDVFVRFLGVPFVVGGMGMFLFGSGMDRLLRFLWVGSLLLLYSCYYWDAFWFHWLLRFLLVTFPVFYGAMIGWIDRTDGRVGKYLMMAFLIVLPFLPVPRFNKGAFDLVRSLPGPPQNDVSARAQVEAVIRPDAVIFTDESRRDALDSRKQFRVYNLRVFQKNYVAVPVSKTPEYDPKMQTSRQREIQSFYQAHSLEELRNLKRERVCDFLREGREVVFLLAPDKIQAEMTALGPEVTLQLVPQEEPTAASDGWTIYEARQSPQPEDVHVR